MPRVTAQQVALSAGVSISAVSRTFTEGGSVSPETRARVEAVAAELGYRPNQLARGLMTGRTRLVGVVLAGVDDPLHALALARIVERLQLLGLHALLARLDTEPGSGGALDMLLQYQVDAALLVGATLPDGFARECQRASVPALHLFGRRAARNVVPVIGADEAAAAAEVARLFIGAKLKRIACITDDAGSDRITSFAETCAGARVAAPPIASVDAASADDGRRAALRLLGAARTPQALFCTDDRLAHGALDACRELGLAVPEQVAIVGWGDLDGAAGGNGNGALSTVRPPVAAMVDDAVSRIGHTLATPGGARLSGKRHGCELLQRATTPG